MWATLIQLEKEKFPCSAEPGDAVSTSLRGAAGTECPRRAASGLSPRRARGGVPARTPVSPGARAAHRPAQRRLPGPRFRHWSEGGAAGTGCPMEMGLGEARERESLTRALPAWGADSSLPVVNVVGWRGGSASRRSSRLPPSPPRSRCLSKWAHRSALLLAFPGETCTNLELFRGSECTPSPSPRRPRPAPRTPGRPLSRCCRASARSLGVSWGERSAAPARAAGSETWAPRQGLGHPAPAQPSAREVAAGIYGAERRVGAGRGAGSPWTCVRGEESRSKKEVEVGGSHSSTKQPPPPRRSRRLLRLNDSRETHTRARPPSSRVRDSEPTLAAAGAEPGALVLSLLPDSPWSRGPGARGPRLARRGDTPLFSPPSPVHVSIPHSRPGGARAAP